MSVLKTFEFTAVQRSSTIPPQQYRRNKLVAHLREQLSFAKADLSGNMFVVKKRRWEMTEDGQKFQIEVEKRLKRWWEVTDQGIAVQVKWANKPVEFDKGKTGILVDALDKLPALFEQLILAAANGEFDKFIADINKLRSATKRKAA